VKWDIDEKIGICIKNIHLPGSGAGLAIGMGTGAAMIATGIPTRIRAKVNSWKLELKVCMSGNGFAVLESKGDLSLI
jgi:hypothetical protein